LLPYADPRRIMVFTVFACIMPGKDCSWLRYTGIVHHRRGEIFPVGFMPVCRTFFAGVLTAFFGYMVMGFFSQ
jgi:hypothetical protein